MDKRERQMRLFDEDDCNHSVLDRVTVDGRDRIICANPECGQSWSMTDWRRIEEFGLELYG